MPRRLLILLLLVFSSWAVARENVWQPGEDNAAWRADCGTCHLAFPPALLPAGDWMEIMAQLETHFGADASLDAKTRQDISDYLKRNGGSSRMWGNRETLPRITTTDRFVDKHRSAIRLWQKGKIKTLTDCVACHKEADPNAAKE
ncbi:MAG: hypothetical protein WCG50_17495 [Rhodoferax sp.]|uniref:hypothetical protein n=1 Tax=Rhodoferax sp. TaxID=50421 RepID=UPI003019CE6A